MKTRFRAGFVCFFSLQIVVTNDTDLDLGLTDWRPNIGTKITRYPTQAIFVTIGLFHFSFSVMSL